MKKFTLLCLMLVICMMASAQYVLEEFDDFIPTHANSAYISDFTTYKGKLYFYAQDTAYGHEMRMIDSNGQPQLAFDINPSNNIGELHVGGGYYRATLVWNDTMYFSGGASFAGGRRLWRYDGTNPPQAITDPYTGKDIGPHLLTPAGSLLYLVAMGQLHSYNPATQQWKQHTHFDLSKKQITDIAYFKGKIYFTESSTGDLLVHTPGVSDTFSVAAHITSAGSNGPFPLYVYNNTLYFLAIDNLYKDLYSYDGTNPPVRLTNSNIPPGVVSLARSIIGYNNNIYFSAPFTATTDSRLYKYETATGNTSIAHDFGPVDKNIAQLLTPFRNKILFISTYSAKQLHLWTYNDTTAPQEINLNGIVFSGTGHLTVFKDQIYFSARPGLTGGEVLYRLTDTTAYYPPDTTDTPSHIATIPLKGKITVHPNPAHDAATLEISLQEAQAFAITLADVYGRAVHTIPSKQYNIGTQRITLPMQSLPAGIYYYRVSNGNVQMASGKVMKE